METVVNALELRISQALANVMGENQTDVFTFLAFADRGDFSKPRGQLPNITSDTSGLLIAFTTFLVSEALIFDGWHVVASLDTDPLGLTNGSVPCPEWTQYNESALQSVQEYDGVDDSLYDGRYLSRAECVKQPHFNYYGLDCYDYDVNGQCNNSYWWYSQQFNAAFTLAKDPYNGYWQHASKAEKDPTSILQAIFANKWSTGQLLLEKAGVCTVDAAVYASIEGIAGEATERLRYRSWPPIYLAQWIFNLTGSAAPSLADIKSGSTSPLNDALPLMTSLLKNDMSLSPPNGVNYSISSNGVTNFDCTSQLNLSIYTDWPSVWYLHKKLT